jgi:hypothetical protein
MHDSLPAGSGLTVRDVARRYRVSPDRVRSWIVRGELEAVNTRDTKCSRPRYVVMPEALARFEQGRAVRTAPRPTKRRRRTAMTDFYPD